MTSGLRRRSEGIQRLKVNHHVEQILVLLGAIVVSVNVEAISARIQSQLLGPIRGAGPRRANIWNSAQDINRGNSTLPASGIGCHSR